MYIKKGDKVEIICGKYKGQHSNVTKAMPSMGKVIVEGINQRTKHVKPQRGEKGHIKKFDAPIDVSNVQLIDSSTGKPTRIKKSIIGGKKERIAVKSGKKI